MVSWSVSRHPEWDMMYSAGLTVREIADACHRLPATVHAHVRKREKYDPDYRTKHEMAYKSRLIISQDRAWQKNLNDAADFYTSYGRLPSRHGDEHERTLYYWILDQRKSYEKGQLDPTKISKLNCLPVWNIDRRQQALDETWKSALSELVKFVSDNGYMPRYRTYSSKMEHALGVWLHNQHQKRTNGTLQAWRLEQLNQQVPNWRRNS